MANNGKICISICASTADELLDLITRAEHLADVIELRFDCLEPGAIDEVLDTLPFISKPYLFTYRPKEQGGHRELSVATRIKFWSRVLSKLHDRPHFVDHEFDIDFPLGTEPDRQIVSVHDFTGVPDELTAQYKALSISTAKTVKIAVAANSVTDAIPVWKLLESANRDGKNFIPIAMGQAGKWTRILGLAHGAFMTYASLDSGSETAPGQISAEDMHDVFRAQELDKDTEVYGIIAGDTSYSMSPWMHNTAFMAAGMNRVFIPLQTSSVDEFMQRMVKPETREVELNFRGFSVTNPHKQSILRQLDHVDETAAAIGAVNTVKIDGDKFHGFNTDAPGFIAPLKKIFGDLKGSNVAVAGAGGAARAVIFALTREGANVTLFVRDLKKAAVVSDEFGIDLKQLGTDHWIPATDILVNTTPLGTKGDKEEETIATAEHLDRLKLVYDLVFNPPETRLIREAKKAGVQSIGGLEMLIAQGVKQFEIWTGETAPVDAMSAAIRKKMGL
jgi:3-dehydroquinate dehydratase/shikimate dehydrogenase